ncbi:MAG: TetR/AcrR family transcriptional regulator [Janthinobacterium lividum]
MADLMRAAEELFASVGYDATTMSGIAHLAGASIGSLYQFFPSKESIGGALLLGYIAELNDQLEQWRAALPSTPSALARELINIVLDYVSRNPACRVLAETPSLVPESYGMEQFSNSVQNVLGTFSPSMRDAELSAVGLTTSLMVRAAVQGSRMVDANKSALLRKEMQQALGSYLEMRLGD